MRYPNGKDQIEWIRNNLPTLEKLQYLKDRLNILKNRHEDLANYIYVSCRCAVAHSSVDPVYDPENVNDEARYYEINPIIYALAKTIIENEFGIKTTSKIIGEHLYELEGFKQILGNNVSKGLKSGDTLLTSDIKINCKISLRLWNRRKFSAFEKLTAKPLHIENGVLNIELTRNGLINIPLILGPVDIWL